MDIKLVGPIFGVSGISQSVRELALALNKKNINIQLVDIPNFDNIKALLNNDTISLLNKLQNNKLSNEYIALYMYPIDFNPIIDNKAKKNIAWSIYETNKVPYIWKLLLNKYDEVWTASEFNKETYSQSGVNNVSVVPYGINTDIYKKGIEPLPALRNKDNFYFLYVSTFKLSKGIDILLNAFFDEFKDNSNVKLILKTDFGTCNYENEKVHIKNIIKQVKKDSKAEIMLICDNLSEEYMTKLYSTADCFVMPSRGEGFGLGYASSMACGVPVIATNYSAHTSFCNINNSLMIDGTLKQIDSIEWLMQNKLQQEHSWFEPNYNKLKEAMRVAFEHPDELKQLGDIAHNDIQKFSWDNVVNIIINKISSNEVNLEKKEITIGNHLDIKGVGDSILLTAVAREVKKKYPNSKIIVKTTARKDIFENNPNISICEEGLIENGIDTGTGHYIERKCRFYGIENPELKGDIFFTEKEIKVAKETLKLLSGEKPTVMFCFNSTDKRRNWEKENWEKIVNVLNKKYDVYQLEENIHYHRLQENEEMNGMPVIFEAVNGARQELRGLDLRKVSAIMSISKKYLGTNTGFMHIATCFSNDNFVFMHRGFAGIEEWIYPKNRNFWEYESVDDVIEKIKKEWL